MARDRRARLIQSTTANGIDFVHDRQCGADAAAGAFPQRGLSPRLADRADHDHRRRNHTDRERAADQAGRLGWRTTAMRCRPSRRRTGDFSHYLLTIPSSVLDIFFSAVSFTFKAGCWWTPTSTACPRRRIASLPPAMRRRSTIWPRISSSFRQALRLLDPALPVLAERSEADFGVMFLEALSAWPTIPATCSRVPGEASLITATQRRSVRRSTPSWSTTIPARRWPRPRC